MKAFVIIFLLVVAAVWKVEAQISTNNSDQEILSKLKKGMTREQAEKALGKQPQPSPNPAPFEAPYYFDFEGMWVLAVFTSSDKDTTNRLDNARVLRDGLTIKEREQKRQEAWSRYVEARIRAQTNRNRMNSSVTNHPTSQAATNR